MNIELLRPAVGYPDGFSVIFDINLSHDQAAARLQYLEDGFFIDNGTRSLLVQLVTYNGQSVPPCPRCPPSPPSLEPFTL
eukprot:jgi/Mesen1/8785/ME000527S08295